MKTDLDLCKCKDYYGIFERYKMMFYKIWDSLSSLKFIVWPEEAKIKISEVSKGKHWYNNGTKNIRAKECPEGFVPGRLKKK